MIREVLKSVLFGGGGVSQWAGGVDEISTS